MQLPIEGLRAQRLDGVDPGTGHTTSQIWRLEAATYTVRTDERAVVYVFVRMDAMHPMCMRGSPLLHACLRNCEDLFDDCYRYSLLLPVSIPCISLASLFNLSLSHHH